MMYELTEKNHQAAMEKFGRASTQEEVLAIDTERYQKIRAETEPLVFASRCSAAVVLPLSRQVEKALLDSKRAFVGDCDL